LIAVFVAIALGGTYLAQFLQHSGRDVPRYTYEEIQRYPHDGEAFTQGLVLKDGIVWESTGKLGSSSVRKSDLKTGEILKIKNLPPDEFGEGLAMVDDKLYQLTWKNEKCYVYDLDLNEIRTFSYRGQGWGLTYDGKHLILSDGTSRLRFIDPETFEYQREITARIGNNAVGGLNELEYSGGSIYANRWNWDNVYEIDPKNGNVKAIIDLKNLWSERPREGILNGIAVDPLKKQLIVTGKYCPHLFEIRLVPRN
jgi:glutamine cyclotransferase